MPVPIWRPRDALPLNQLPRYVWQPYREAAERLEQLTNRREKEAMAKVTEETSRLNISAAKPKAAAAPAPASPKAKAKGSSSSAAKHNVMVGNAHEQLPEENHKWRLYVAGDGAEHLSKVDVWLHPTFEQNHFHLNTMPFELECTGWGTFDIGLRLHKKSGGYSDVTWPLQFKKDDAHTSLEI